MHQGMLPGAQDFSCWQVSGYKLGPCAETVTSPVSHSVCDTFSKQVLYLFSVTGFSTGLMLVQSSTERLGHKVLKHPSADAWGLGFRVWGFAHDAGPCDSCGWAEGAKAGPEDRRRSPSTGQAHSCSFSPGLASSTCRLSSPSRIDASLTNASPQQKRDKSTLSGVMMGACVSRSSPRLTTTPHVNVLLTCFTTRELWSCCSFRETRSKTEAVCTTFPTFVNCWT